MNGPLRGRQVENLSYSIFSYMYLCADVPVYYGLSCVYHGCRPAFCFSFSLVSSVMLCLVYTQVVQMGDLTCCWCLATPTSRLFLSTRSGIYNCGVPCVAFKPGTVELGFVLETSIRSIPVQKITKPLPITL